MKRKSKEIRPSLLGSVVIGQVNLQYVQMNVPDDMISTVVEALAHLILSDHYAQTVPLNNSDGYDRF